jgi:hypothetical protein
LNGANGRVYLLHAVAASDQKSILVLDRGVGLAHHAVNNKESPLVLVKHDIAGLHLVKSAGSDGEKVARPQSG